MKNASRVLLGFAILISLMYMVPARVVFVSITSYPEEWQGGLSEESTIVWLIVITLGYGYLLLQSLLALLGLMWGYSRRKAAFWFLLFPGMTGMVLSLIWIGLFMGFDASWPASWEVVTILLIAPLIAWLTGRYIRRKLLPKTDFKSFKKA